VISTHVLDTSQGRPAAGVAIQLEVERDGGWAGAGRGVTDADGRIRELAGGPLTAGRYRLVFQTGAYFAARATPTFYPVVVVHVTVDDPGQHYHVPLLLSPFGYATYRGS
jgi:5-hydroxyisourate hydrolase